MSQIKPVKWFLRRFTLLPFPQTPACCKESTAYLVNEIGGALQALNRIWCKPPLARDHEFVDDFLPGYSEPCFVGN